MPDLDEQIRELVTSVRPVTTDEVIASSGWSQSKPLTDPSRSRRMKTYALGASAMATAICVLVVVLVLGLGNASSKPTALTPARPGFVPASWQTVTFGGLIMYTPDSWAIGSERSWGDCGLVSQPFFKDNAVELDTGASAVRFPCPSISPNRSVPPVNGLLIDPGPYGPLPDVKTYAKRLLINGLRVDPASTSSGGMLVLAVHIPGRALPVAVEIGLAGGEKVAHTILFSMHSAKASLPPPTTSTTVKKTSTRWPERIIAPSHPVQDIVPTSNGVYWLTVLGQSFTPTVVQPVHYDPTTGKETLGPSITGAAYGPALAVSGGWVWVVVGRADDVLIEQLSPSRLAVVGKWSFTVRDPINGLGSVYPIVTATADGPLWIAGGEDLWGLNPNTGAVEKEFDAGDGISSMSTDPTGELLYTTGPTSDVGGTTVTEYDARTGQKLRRADFGSTAPGTVAATIGGVWVSTRSGMAGGAVELSASGLERIAPPTSKIGGFGTYEQIMGVGSSVSEQTLWLTSTSDLTCADPTTGAIRASESTPMTFSSPAASGQLLYAIAPSDGVVVITPPSACFV